MEAFNTTNFVHQTRIMKLQTLQEKWSKCKPEQEEQAGENIVRIQNKIDEAICGLVIDTTTVN